MHLLFDFIHADEHHPKNMNAQKDPQKWLHGPDSEMWGAEPSMSEPVLAQHSFMLFFNEHQSFSLFSNLMMLFSTYFSGFIVNIMTIF